MVSGSVPSVGEPILSCHCVWSRNEDLDPDEAFELAVEAQHQSRRWVRAALDANVLVSGLIARTGPPCRLLELWLDGAFDLVVSPKLLAETRKTSLRRRSGVA